MTKTYKDFINGKPRPFYGDKRVDSLIYRMQEMESKCTNEHIVKFTTCTFIGRALIWWSTQVKALGVDKGADDKRVPF